MSVAPNRSSVRNVSAVTGEGIAGAVPGVVDEDDGDSDSEDDDEDESEDDDDGESEDDDVGGLVGRGGVFIPSRGSLAGESSQLVPLGVGGMDKFGDSM